MSPPLRLGVQGKPSAAQPAGVSPPLRLGVQGKKSFLKGFSQKPYFHRPDLMGRSRVRVTADFRNAKRRAITAAVHLMFRWAGVGAIPTNPGLQRIRYALKRPLRYIKGLPINLVVAGAWELSPRFEIVKIPGGLSL